MAHTCRYGQTRTGVRYVCMLLLLICNSLFFSSQAFAAVMHTKTSISLHTISPPVSNDPLFNPGKGWVLYGSPKGQPANVLAYASVGYTRYNWSQIEPKEGVYNWSVIDNDLNAWRAVGKQFAFGVMNANSSNPTVSYVTPQWVFQDGAAYIKAQTFDHILNLHGIQYVPVWNDPIFLNKVENFLYALAQRYDGNPNIAYIDIRSYGNWGVMKVDGLAGSKALSVTDAQKHVQLYTNAFHHTQLILPWAMNTYSSMYSSAVNQHIGLRRDGIMVDSTGSELLPAYGKAPGVFEFYGTYQWLLQNGYWKDNTLLSDVNTGRPSYISLGEWGSDAQAFVSQRSQLVASLVNKMGYHFVLTSATLPTAINNGAAITYSLSWNNQGVAYLTQPASVAIALLDSSGQVVQKQWLMGANPDTWTPGTTATTKATLTFQQIPPGTYTLAVGLFRSTNDSTPTYNIGNQGRTSTGWYVLSTSVPVA